MPLDVTDSTLGARDRRARSAARSTSWSTTPSTIAPSASPRAAGVETARAEMDVNYFGLLRLAQEFGPAMRARGADGQSSAVAWVNLLSIYALANFPPHGTFSASKAAALLARAVPARRDAARRACASSTSSRARSTTSGTSCCRRRSSRRRPWRARSSQALRDGVEDVYPGRRRAGVARALARQPQGARAGALRMSAPGAQRNPWRERKVANEHATLAKLVADLAAGRIRVVDLTQTLSPDFPQIVAAARDGPVPGRSGSRRSRATTSAGRRGTGTTSPAASTPARTSTRRSTGSRAATCRTTPSTPFPPEHFVGARLRDRLLEGSGGRPGLPAHRARRDKPGRRSTAASRRARGC